jgi:integrase
MASVKKVRWTYKGVTSEVWAVKYVDLAGKRRQRIPKSGLKKDADALRLVIEREIGDGTHTVRSQTVTVAEAFEAWLGDCERRWRIKDGMAGTTLQKYRVDAKVLVKRIGSINLADLSSQRIKVLLRDLSEHYAASTVRTNKMMALRQMLKFAVREGLLKRNPLDDNPVRSPMDRKERPALPSKEELQALLGALASRQFREHAHVRRNRLIMVMLAMFAGLRAGEICGLQWGDIDFARNGINVRHSLSRYDGLKEPKSRAGNRFVPMAPPLAEMLQSYRDTLGEVATGYVMTTRKGGAILPHHLNAPSSGYWPALCRAAGLLSENGRTPKFPLHRLRHVAVSLWLEGGLDAMHVKTMVGHESISTTIDIYGHLFPENDQARLAVGKATAQFQLPSSTAAAVALPAPSARHQYQREKNKKITQPIDIAV